MRVTNEIFEKRLKILHSVRDYLYAHEPDLMKASVRSGLTEGGAKLDIGLMYKQMLNIELDRDRLVGKEVGEGTVLAAIIPFDVPNFMVPFYCATAYLAGKDVVMRFGDVIKPIGAVWQRAFDEIKPPAIRIDHEMSGPEFGEWAIREEAVRHFILAGGLKVLKAYSKDSVAESFDSVVMSGPTRPKAIIDASAEGMLECAVGTTVRAAFMGSGQLCAFEKEVIPAPEVYDETKRLLIEAVKKVDFGSPENTVGPLGDKWVIIGLAAMYDRIKNDPKYEILVGGGYDCDKGIFEPTLVEAPEGVEDDIHYFGPLVFLNGAARNGMTPAEVACSDKMHGGYAYAWTPDIYKGVWYEGVLKQDFGTVRINSNILNEFFDWPFGGFKKSFIAFRREEDGMVEYHGRVHHSFMLTGITKSPGK